MLEIPQSLSFFLQDCLRSLMLPKLKSHEKGHNFRDKERKRKGEGSICNFSSWRGR